MAVNTQELHIHSFGYWLLCKPYNAQSEAQCPWTVIAAAGAQNVVNIKLSKLPARVFFLPGAE